MHLWCCAYLNAKQQPSKKTSRSQGSVMICISSELQCFWASPSVHPVAIPLLHQHSACSLENTIAIVGNGRFGPPFPSNTASIWTGSKDLQECWGVASLYVLSRQDVLAMGQGGKLSKEAIGAEFAQSAQSAPAMSNVLIEKKGVAVGGAEDSHRKAEGSQHRISAILCMLGRVCFDFAWGRAMQHRCHTTGSHMHPCLIWAELFWNSETSSRLFLQALVQSYQVSQLLSDFKSSLLTASHDKRQAPPWSFFDSLPEIHLVQTDNSGWKLKVNIPVLQGRNATHVYWWFTSIQLGPWARLFSALKKVCTTFQQPQVMLVKKISRAQAIQEAAATSKNNQNDQHSLRCKFGGASPASSVLAIAGNFGWKHEWVSGCGQ